MPSFGHQRSYSFGQKSIYLGRCVKHQFIRRFASVTSPKKSDVLPNPSLNLNTSALPEKPIFRSGLMLPTFNRHQDLNQIPPAPPFPSNFNERFSTETIKSTDFSKAIKNHHSSITPSGTDLAQSMIIRPSQMAEPPMIQSKIYPKPNLRNRRRTPLTPDVLALTKLRRPEHIKSSIAQRIEELKQASSINNPTAEEKAPIEARTDLLVTCEYQNNEAERHWLKEQTRSHCPVRFLNTTSNYLQLNNRLFLIRSIEFLENKTVRFSIREPSAENFLTKYLKQISILTILIISILRLIENALANLSIPGMQIILNFIYIFILITVAIILLTNQK